MLVKGILVGVCIAIALGFAGWALGAGTGWPIIGTAVCVLAAWLIIKG